MIKHHHKKHHQRKLTSVEIALEKFLSSVNFKPKIEIISIQNTSSRVLAKDVISKIEIPSFNKASMDGFAIKSSDTKNVTKKNPVYLKVVGKIFAGDTKKKSIKVGEAIAISTGSPLPGGADSVIMIEDIIKNKDKIKIIKKIKKQSNIALKGEEVRKNQLILKKGTWLTPQDIGLIASIGLNQIPVFKRPSIGILATGNELAKPGTDLKKGKIFESNRIVIAELVKQMGGKIQDLGICKDEKKVIEKKVKKGLQNDVLVITGGSSVGERDFVPKILNDLGKPGVIVKGVAMKPGSPVTLAMIQKTPIIVCPGFPVSSFFAFFMFGNSLLKQMLSTKGPPISEIQAKMENGIKTQQNVTNFVRVRIRKIKGDYFTRSVSTADSRLLITLTGSDGVIIAKNRKELKKGDLVNVITFRNVTMT
jgi:molybdopterin molybdotransferase